MAFERNDRRGSGRTNERRSSGRDGGRDSSFSNRNSGRTGGNRSNRGSGEMHSAVCDKCGSRCELPFKPTGDKPVLCSDCFRKAGPSRGNSNVDLSEINKKLDKILELLE